MPTFEEYEKAFIAKASLKGKDKEYIQTCLKYAKPILDKECPVIYDSKNLSLLVGYKESYLLRAITYTQNYYWTFKIPKKNGEMREITEPLPSLKEIQSWILQDILYKIPAHKFAKAYIPGKKIRENVKFHTHKKYVIAFDIHDFFGSIRRVSIEQIFSEIGYSDLVSNLLSKLCTLNGCLPQGAPTSPYLSNLFMRDFDEHMKQYCDGKKIMYTRYADDMTFSSDDMDINALKREVNIAVTKKGLSLNSKKTHIMRYDNRQIVTGIVVNRHPRLPKEERKKLRLVMHYVYLNGLAGHIKNEKIVKLNYGRYLLGKVNYALSLEPSNLEYKNFKIFLMQELFPNYKRRLKHLRLGNMETLKEVEVLKLPDDCINAVNDIKNVPKTFKGIPFVWGENSCHQNTVLFDDFLRQQKNATGLTFGITEGVVITINEFAYTHIWNYVRQGKKTAYYDVTRDCFQNPQIRAIDRRYYPIRELTAEELIENRANGGKPFGEKANKYFEEYYKTHPRQYEKYCELWRKLNGNSQK
jgi:RNA-directed DNA polymerase